MSDEETLEDGGSPALRSAVLRSIERQPDASYALYHLCACWGQLAFMLLLFQLLPPGLGPRLLFFLAMGWTQYRLYFLLHDLCHFSLFASPAANQVLGRITASMLLSSFSTFTWIHMEHHRLYGTREDPGSVDYFVRFRGRMHALRFFLEPFLCLILVEKVREYLLLPAYRMLVRSDDLRRQARDRARRLRPHPIAELSSGVAVQALIFSAITGLGTRPFDYFFFYALPLGTVFLALARLRMYLEHGPLDYAVSDYEGESARRIARTHAPGGLSDPLLSFMNFRYHQEHHLFPTLPSCRLPEVHERFVRAELDPDDFSPSYDHSLRRLVQLTKA